MGIQQIQALLLIHENPRLLEHHSKSIRLTTGSENNDQSHAPCKEGIEERMCSCPQVEYKGWSRAAEEWTPGAASGLTEKMG